MRLAPLFAVLAVTAHAQGFDTAGMDGAAKPGDDFYEYANGTFVRNLVIPADKTTYGAFAMLADQAQEQSHGLLTEAAAAATTTDPVQGKVGAFYAAFMDAARVEQRGLAPLAPYLDDIRDASGKQGLARLMGRASSSFHDSVFALGVGPDSKDPTQYSVGIDQAGLGLPDRDYYLTDAHADQRARYALYVAQTLDIAGWSEPSRAAAGIVAFETRIAEVSWTRADQRDPERTYNPVAQRDLAALAPGFDWPAFLAAARIPPNETIVVGEPSAVTGIARVFADTDIDTLKAWAAFHAVANAAPYLPSRVVDASFAFNGTFLQGVPKITERWKRGERATNRMLGEALGQLYVARYFPPDSLAKMQALTADVRAAYRKRLAANDWMAPQTKAAALEKLDKFATQIGYPRKWRDYAAFVVARDDLFGNIERGMLFSWRRHLSQLGTVVDRDEWYQTPQTVNAYNAPNFNEIVFPAAILRPPFFDPDADPAVNYGAIGGVIGHEMTHGFDDKGRKFDADGRLRDWWTPADAAAFDERAQRLGAQFAAMEPLPGAHINPQLTMGENIADLGGLTLALDAYHASLRGAPAPVIDGLSGDQRVFLGWAQVWRAKQRPEALRQALLTDPHSPPAARVNGPMPNIDSWYEAFGVKPGDTLYRAPADRVKIW